MVEDIWLTCLKVWKVCKKTFLTVNVVYFYYYQKALNTWRNTEMTRTWGEKWSLNLHLTCFKCQIENQSEVKLGVGAWASPIGGGSESEAQKGCRFHSAKQSAAWSRTLSQHCWTEPLLGSGSEKEKLISSIPQAMKHGHIFSFVIQFTMLSFWKFWFWPNTSFFIN